MSSTPRTFVFGLFMTLVGTLIAAALISASATPSGGEKVTRAEMYEAINMATYGGSSANMNTIVCHSDFLNGTTSTSNDCFRNVLASGVQASGSVGDADSPGIAYIGTGTSATGTSCLVTDESIQLGGGSRSWLAAEIDSTNAYSNASDKYIIIVGFFDNTAANQATDGVYFLYDSTAMHTGVVGSGNWQCVTSANGVRTIYDTGIDFSLGNQMLRVDIIPGVAAQDSAIFSINGDWVRSETTNIPTGYGQRTRAGAAIRKGLGATQRFTYIDWIQYGRRLARPR